MGRATDIARCVFSQDDSKPPWPNRLLKAIENMLRRSRVGHASRAAQLGCSSSVRAWSIWSYAYVAMAVVVMVSPLWASDS
jgi:hypothetical protein